MNIKLVEHLQKLNEEDLFPEASSEELADRERNRPPRVLRGKELEEILKN